MTGSVESSKGGWYGPPNARRWHYIAEDSRSLCGKWLVPAWSEELIDRTYGPDSGDCAACKTKLAALIASSPEGTNR